MESERLCIRLDNPDRIFYAGQVIRGEIWMNLNKRTKIRGKFELFLLLIYLISQARLASWVTQTRPQSAMVSSEFFWVYFAHCHRWFRYGRIGINKEDVWQQQQLQQQKWNSAAVAILRLVCCTWTVWYFDCKFFKLLFIDKRLIAQQLLRLFFGVI